MVNPFKKITAVVLSFIFTVALASCVIVVPPEIESVKSSSDSSEVMPPQLEGETKKAEDENASKFVSVIREELSESPEIAAFSDEELLQLGGLYCEYFAQGETIDALITDIFKDTEGATEDQMVTVAATVVAAAIYLCPEYDYLAAEYLQ